MPSIIEHGLLELWLMLLRLLPENIWHCLAATDAFHHSVQSATSLSIFEYETILRRSGITFKKGDMTMFSKSHLEYLKEAIEDNNNVTLHITQCQLPGSSKRLFFVALGKPLFCNPRDQAKAIPTIDRQHWQAKGLDEERMQFIKRLCADEEKIVILPIEDQPVVLVTPKNTNSSLFNNRNCIGIDNSRIERYKDIDMKYCLSKWSYLNGWRSHSCTFLFCPAVEKERRCKHCLSAYTNINKERHPNLFMDEERTKNVKSHSEICEAANLLRSCLTRLVMGNLPLGTQGTTDTHLFQVIKALNSLNMTSPILLSSSTKIIFCPSFQDAMYEKENRCPGIFTVETGSTKQEKCDYCAGKTRNECRREMRLNDSILDSNSHANLCNLSKPQLVQRLRNVKDCFYKKMRKKVDQSHMT